MSNFKRFISMALALAMVLSMIPAGVYAEDGTTDFAPAEYTNLLIGPGSATSAGPEYPSGSI